MAPPDILILRPQPGAAKSAQMARTLGLEALVAPIFHVVPLPWDPPPAADYEAIVITSAFAAREAGRALDAYLHLPCYAVGDASADAARQAGFPTVRAGPSDAAALVEMMQAQGIGRALHLCGQDHLALDLDGVERRIVYSSDPLPFLLPEAVTALIGGTLPLLHSPRAGRHFAKLVEGAGLDKARIRIAAISKAAEAAAGPGWGDVAIAAAPRDAALLELAASLCNKPRTAEDMKHP